MTTQPLNQTPQLEALEVQPVTQATPTFGSKRLAAMALYDPPFKFLNGYVYDANDQMFSDDAGVDKHIAARVRGWGRIGYLPHAAELQDEVGRVIAEALTAFWAPHPVAQPLTDEQASALGKAALEKWNAQADDYNHWDNLGLDEMALLIAREVETAHGITMLKQMEKS